MSYRKRTGMGPYYKRLFSILFGLVIIFAIFGSAGVATWEYTNSDKFCSNACHSVHPEEPLAHQTSQHTNVRCVECHIGRISTFEAISKNAIHVSRAWAMLAGYERPLSVPSMPPSEDSCESCHSSQPHKNNVLKVRHHFAVDENNSETRTGLIMRTIGRQVSGQSGSGIQWHPQHQVRFVATDQQQQQIPWVEVTYEDGTTDVFTDTSHKLPESNLEQAEKQLMECKDCHNRVGHPFRNPEEILNEALANGTLDKKLPFVKARAMALLKHEFKDNAEAQKLVEEAWEKYQKDFPHVFEQIPQAWAESKSFLKQRQEFLADLMVTSKFNKPGISWRSFPDNNGHKYSPGCFRCHSGKHRNAEGKPIPMNCTTCHSVPVTLKEGFVPKNLFNVIDMPKPESHLQRDFMQKHWKKFTKNCSTCHGQISYGTDDKTFCANSACHKVAWPNINLRAGTGTK